MIGPFNHTLSLSPSHYLYLIVMWWQLVEELSDPVLLSGAVDVRHLFLWQTGEIHLHLRMKTDGWTLTLSVPLSCTLGVIILKTLYCHFLSIIPSVRHETWPVMLSLHLKRGQLDISDTMTAAMCVLILWHCGANMSIPIQSQASDCEVFPHTRDSEGLERLMFAWAKSCWQRERNSDKYLVCQCALLSKYM